MNSKRRLIKQLLDTEGFLSYKFSGRGIMLKKGKYSPIYINFKVLWSNPNLMRNLSKKLSDKVKGSDLVIGIEAGGCPFAAVVAYELKIPLILVRKEPKGKFGILTSKVANDSESISIVDDVLASGNSISKVLCNTKKPNRKIRVVNLLSYGLDKRISRKYKIEVISLFQIEEILKFLEATLADKLAEHIISYKRKIEETLL